MEDDQQFCLRWNNHQSTLIQNFDTLLESGTLVDCTLAAEGKYLKAHKVVLSACSPYFEGLLSEHYDKHPVFILKDVKFKELKAMMDYMYRGEVNISQDQLAALLKAAESLQIKGLSESKTGGGGGTSGGSTGVGTKTESRQIKSSTQPTASSTDIPHTSSGLTIEKNKVPRQNIVQTSVSDVPEDSASPQVQKGLSSREGSLSPTSRKRKRFRRRSMGDDNSVENHEASNSSDMPQQMGVPALGIAPVADEKVHADPTDSLGRSALMQQLTKPAEEMLQLEKPEPNDNLIEPKSEYLEDPEESVEDLTLDDDMNDLTEMEADGNRAGPSHDPSQHPAGLAAWHVTGDRSNAGGVVGSVAGGPGTTDEVFLAAQEAAQAHRDSQAPRYGGGQEEMDNHSDEIDIKEELALVTAEDSYDSSDLRSSRSNSPELNDFFIESSIGKPKSSTPKLATLRTKIKVGMTTRFVSSDSENENSVKENSFGSKDRGDIVQTPPKGKVKGKGKEKAVVSSPTHIASKIRVLSLHELQRNENSVVSRPRTVNDRENKVGNEDDKEKDASPRRWVMRTRSRGGVEGDKTTLNKTELPRKTSKTLQQTTETQNIKKAAKKKEKKDESSKSEDDEEGKGSKKSKKDRVVKDSNDVDSAISNEEIGDDAKNLNIWKKKKKDRVQAGTSHDDDSEQLVALALKNGRNNICPYCKKDFLRKEDLIRHWKFKCPACPANTRSRMFGKEATERMAEGASKKFICPKCSAQYKYRKGLNHHMNYHCGKLVTCPGCKKSLATTSWRNHKIICGRYLALPPSKQNKNPNVKEEYIHVSEDDTDFESTEE